MPAKRRPDPAAVAYRTSLPMPYFPHDADAAQDVKCKRLLHRLGFEGYGRWWYLCELLAGGTGHEIDFSDAEDAEILASDLGMGSAGELADFVATLSDVGLLDPGAASEGKIRSPRMDRNAENLGYKRAAGALGGRPRK